MSREISGDRTQVIAELQLSLQRSSGSSVLFSQLIAKTVGIHSTDLESLGSIVQNPAGTTAGDLAAVTGLTTGAVTGVIDRLVEAGFVRRERDEHDKRKVLVLPNFEQIVQRVFPLYQSLTGALHELCGHYSDAELSTILDFSQRMEGIMQAEVERLRAPRP